MGSCLTLVMASSNRMIAELPRMELKDALAPPAVTNRGVLP
jgi:hypothetical protein